MPRLKDFRTFLFSALLLTGHAVLADSGEQLMQRGAEFARQGQVTQALDHWQQALTVFRTEGQHAGQARAWYRIGMLHFQHGHYSDALQAFNQAQYLLQKRPHAAMQSAVSAAMGSVYLQLGDLNQALPLLTNALALAKQQQLAGQSAAILNDLANLAVRKGRYTAAITHYQAALSLIATEKGMALLRIRLYSNAMVAARMAGNQKQLQDDSQQLQAQLKQLAPDEVKISALIQAADVYRWLTTRPSPAQQRYADLAVQLLQQAIEHTADLNRPLLRAQALGGLAQLYYQAGRDQDALRLNRQALFLAQQGQVIGNVGGGTAALAHHGIDQKR